jgi:hypothetical protein
VRIVAYTYVDHQEEIGYPIGLVTRNLSFCDRIHFFGSDSENTACLLGELISHPLRERISCHEIGRKIHVPADIAVAQNACLEWIRKNETFDFVIGLQADIMIGGLAMDLIRRITSSEKYLSESVLIPVDHVRCYAVAHRTRFGCVVIGKDAKVQFVGDGAYTEPYRCLVEEEKNPNIYCLDVGYFTPEMYFRHVRRNARTWNSATGTAMADTYHRNRDDFIRQCLRKVRFYERGDIPLTPIDPNVPEHIIVMDYFKCRDDYNHVRGIIEQLRRET